MSKDDKIIVGLRVDVDTLRGTKLGVPNLVQIMAERGIRASFFFSAGPDNMGRNLWRLLRPAFLMKMLRSKAASLYGWDIIFKGTFWPGPLIGQRAAAEIRQAADAGHEIGFHAWDHHRWQDKIETLSQDEIERDCRRGITQLAAITGQPVTCAAAPAWRLSDAGLRARSALSLRYASDCRGTSIFKPKALGIANCPPQIPVTLPTYDEVIGRNGIDQDTYNNFMLDQLLPGQLNVLTIHAEAEGLSCRSLFSDFLDRAAKRGVQFCALGDLLTNNPEIHHAPMIRQEIPGRDGWLSWQGLTETP